jgi:hypothetical protein
MGEFLNPKSMLTPGAAGAVMMFVVNGLGTPFPDLPRRYVALALSFLLSALIVLKLPAIRLPERLGYWVLNSFMIFVIGFGANTLGREATSTPPTADREHSMSFALVSSAYAAETAPKKPAAPARPAGDKKKAEPEKADKAKTEKAFFKKW